jgi:thioredoxin 2
MASLRSDDRGVITPCPSCGQKNRLAYETLGHDVRCAQCKELLPQPAAPVDIARAEDFDRLVSTSPIPVVVDFWAPWCGPCRMVAPEIEKVAARSAGRFLVVKVDTDAVPELGDRLGIRSIPTMSVFANGREASRTTGARPAADIERFVDAAVNQPTHR